MQGYSHVPEGLILPLDEAKIKSGEPEQLWEALNDFYTALKDHLEFVAGVINLNPEYGEGTSAPTPANGKFSVWKDTSVTPPKYRLVYGDNGAQVIEGPKVVESRALLQHTTAGGVNGGSLTAGSWVTRTLNTKLYDPDGIVSLSNNQFTLGAGRYRIRAKVLFDGTDASQARLYNVTDGAVQQNEVGVNIYGTTVRAYYTSAFSEFDEIIKLTATKTFVLQSAVTTTNSLGCGIAAAWANIFTQVWITKLG